MICAGPECEREAAIKGLCPSHYKQSFRGPLAPITPRDSGPCTVCADVELLVLSGEVVEQVSARLGLRPESLRTHLNRHGRKDVADRLRPMADVPPFTFRY